MEGDCDTFISWPETNLWQNYHNGLGVLSSSMYMIGLWAHKKKKRKKDKKKGGGECPVPPSTPPPPPHRGTAPDQINTT